MSTTNSKSAEQAMLQQALSLATSGKKVTYISLEHTHEEVALLVIAAHLGRTPEEVRRMAHGVDLTDRNTIKDAHMAIQARCKEAGGELRFTACEHDSADALTSMAGDSDYLIAHLPKRKPVRGHNRAFVSIDTLGFWPSPGTSIVTDAGKEVVAKAALPSQYAETLDVLARKWTPGTYLDITDEGHLVLCVPDDNTQSMLGVSFTGGCRDFIIYMLGHAWYELVESGIEGGRWIVRADDTVFRNAKLADASDYT